MFKTKVILEILGILNVYSNQLMTFTVFCPAIITHLRVECLQLCM